MALGSPICSSAPLTASVACDRDTPTGRLKDMVEAANWLWWVTLSGVLVGA